MDNDQWSSRKSYAYVGLGKVTVGGCIIAYAFSNAHTSPWYLHQFAFGGFMVYFGFLHLSLAWNMDPPPPNPPICLACRVRIRGAENKRGDPDLAGEGLHQNFPPIAGGIRDVGEANPHDVDGARPANFGAGESRAGSGGLLRRRKPVQQDIACKDQEIGDNNEFGPDNAVKKVGQAKASEEVGQADDVEESDQADNEGELGQDADESESSNVVNKSALPKNVGEGGANK